VCPPARDGGVGAGKWEGELVSQARILAVDDQLYFRVFLEDLLQDAGYEVVAAGSGQEAIDWLESEAFDVVLTDLVMPGMDGSELVQRIRERWPEQQVVVVTSVGDVKTAVDAMKLGATDYLLKPLDRTALLRSLGAILEQRRMADEHRQLVAENLEYLNVFTQIERMLGLFHTLALEPLADRIVETFCLETNAHGGVLWLARPDAPTALRLAGVGGLVRVEEELEELDTGALPELLAPLADSEARAWIGPDADDKEGEGASVRGALYLPLRSDGVTRGILRLNDKLDGTAFSDADREVADRLGAFAGQAVANALQFRSLERRSFRDAVTQAYSRAYFEDVVRNEVQKAQRFSRSFSLVRVRLDGIDAVREALAPADFATWFQKITGELGRALRTTDLLAAEDESTLCALLPETDALGAAVAKRRLRSAVERGDVLREMEAELRPTILAASATYGADGQQVEELAAALDRAIDDDRDSVLRAFDLEQSPFRGLIDALLSEAPTGRAETAEQMTRFVLSELGRRPHERGMLFIAPGAGLISAVREGLEEIRGHDLSAEIVLVADRRTELSPGVPVTWVSPVRAGTDAPFLVYYGEGPAYALIREAQTDGQRDLALYHTSDPVIVEHLAFQLGRDLGIPIGD
jgi:diguanylate cyclase (GGDEF)-like protein